MNSTKNVFAYHIGGPSIQFAQEEFLLIMEKSMTTVAKKKRICLHI